jgi:hypothetical protein
MKSFFKYLRENIAGIQGTMFLIFAILNLFIGDKFWMFMISSITFTALQAIINELRILNKK